ncbi:MAG: nitrilase-related carbon-nitrogen hydrolase, partial [Nitrospinaceae bacterium]
MKRSARTQAKSVKKSRTKSRSAGKTSPSGAIKLRLALAQINPVVGDFKFNADKVKDCLKEAKKHQADIVLFPELALTGYPPEDLLLKDGFIRKNLETLNRLVPYTEGITAVVGYAEPARGGLFNSAALLSNGRLLGSYRKMLLPNYGVFDEKRYFTEGNQPLRFTQKGVILGITICEDIWVADGPGKILCDQGEADVLLNISSSPDHRGRGKERVAMIRKRARQYKSHIVYTTLVGGQ